MAGQAGKCANSLWYVSIYISGFTLVMLLLAGLFTMIGSKLNETKSELKIFKKIDSLSAWLIILVGIAYFLYNSHVISTSLFWTHLFGY
jgi:cytochrome c biogenesis protein CcdA